MNLNLHDKVILITGGAKGIGEGIARVLLAEGATVALVDRDEAALQKTVDSLTEAGGRAYGFWADLTKPDDCQRAVNEVLKKTDGQLNGLVNNAGVNDGINLSSGNYEAFMASLHRNVVHYYLMAHHALPALKAAHGAIVNITSKVAETGQGGTSAYAAANGGRNALTREWAVELLPDGIRVNAVVVAECWTPLYENWLNTLPDPAATLRDITAKIPLGQRMTTPTEIANMVAFLLSDLSSHTTGQLIHVDGGYTHLDRAV
ncbi:SDR family oxidoreductase [Fibrella sp. HMF5335]|uniref:SDR family oxidoreductase n=1 Tax=Fibrella rubiginis TaxID=2817060 RepID=A0A939GCC1_9BACT|nr:SDR family oxidoreductase [Fibrella rubiginis]MBO0934940.1 SDR family oxidoreductase [Fibrella rubiginis]